MADERFPGTTQGDMVPVQEQDANAIKRVFRVKKQRRELFGWKLIPIGMCARLAAPSPFCSALLSQPL